MSVAWAHHAMISGKRRYNQFSLNCGARQDYREWRGGGVRGRGGRKEGRTNALQVLGMLRYVSSILSCVLEIAWALGMAWGLAITGGGGSRLKAKNKA